MLDHIRAYRERVLNADTIEELKTLAVEIIGHSEGFTDDDARECLLDYLAEWQDDFTRAHNLGNTGCLCCARTSTI